MDLRRQCGCREPPVQGGIRFRNGSGVSCNIQKGKRVCDQERKESEAGAMEQNDGFGLGIWGMAEVIDVAVWAEATNEPDTGWRIN